MVDKHKVLAMIKAKMGGENPRKTSVLERWMTVPETPKHQSILAGVERRLASKPEPTDDEIIQAVAAYAKA